MIGSITPDGHRPKNVLKVSLPDPLIIETSFLHHFDKIALTFKVKYCKFPFKLPLNKAPSLISPPLQKQKFKKPPLNLSPPKKNFSGAKISKFDTKWRFPVL